MRSFLATAKRFVKPDDGPTATEYAVMLALIIIASVAAISLLGTEVIAIFDTVQTALGG